MLPTHQFDLSFAIPSRTQTAPEIIFTINQQHLPTIIERLQVMTDRWQDHKSTYLGRFDTDFTLLQEDLFSTTFGYGDCGYLTTEDGKAHLRVRLVAEAGKYYASATLFILVRALGFPFEDHIPNNRHQVVEIMLNAEHCPTGYGHAVGGQLSSALVEWLRKYVNDMTILSHDTAVRLPADVTLSMETVWKAVTEPARHEYGKPPHINGWIRECGAFSLICFGDACDLSIYPDETSHEIGESVQFSCHNLDTAEQQLTLIAGLAKLCELARSSS